MSFVFGDARDHAPQDLKILGTILCFRALLPATSHETRHPQHCCSTQYAIRAQFSSLFQFSKATLDTFDDDVRRLLPRELHCFLPARIRSAYAREHHQASPPAAALGMVTNTKTGGEVEEGDPTTENASNCVNESVVACASEQGHQDGTSPHTATMDMELYMRLCERRRAYAHDAAIAQGGRGPARWKGETWQQNGDQAGGTGRVRRRLSVRGQHPDQLQGREDPMRPVGRPFLKVSITHGILLPRTPY